ncbi:MAG: hypothetical protein LQ351_004798 [Letrouitia transgressa]|nr:MAG: hypothetical protein LQ351_004798 [Letrouitia transgressa]
MHSGSCSVRIDSEPNPADIPTICGPHASRVRAKLRELCNENVQAGLEAFDEVCKNVKGYKSTDSSSPSSSSSPSDSDPPTSTAADPTATGSDGTGSEGTESEGTDTEAGPEPTSTGSSIPPEKAAPYPIPAGAGSTGIGGSTGFVTGTNIPIPTGTSPTGTVTGGAGVGPSSIATGSPIAPAPPKGTDSAGFTGAANKNYGSSSIGILAIIGFTLATW